MNELLKYKPIKNFGSLKISDGDGDPPAEEFITIKDPVTQQDVQIPKSLESFTNHLISGTRGVVKKDLQKEHDRLTGELREQLAAKEKDYVEIDAKLQEIQELGQTAEQKAKNEYDKVSKENALKVEKAETESKGWKDLYFEHKKVTDTFSSFDIKDVHNPEQVVQLFLTEGGAEVVEIINDQGEKTGKFETIVNIDIEDKDGKIESLSGTPKELFGKWIAKKQNFHHVINTLEPGGGSNFSRKPGAVDSNMLEGLSPVERMKIARQQEKQ